MQISENKSSQLPYLLGSSCSHFDLVLVVENLESLAILDDLCPFLQLELEQGVRDDTNSDVDGLNVVLNSRDSLFNISEGRVVRELFAGIVNLALDVSKTIVDFLQFSFESLNILADSGETSLDFSKSISMGAVVTSHSLEVSREDALLARDLLKSTAGVVLKTLKLSSNLGEGGAHFLGKDLGLLQMRAPFFATFTDLAKFQLVSDSFDLKLPFFFANIRLNDGVICLLGFKLTGHLSLDVAAAKVQVFVDVITTLLSMDLVGHIGITLHIISVIVSFVIATLTFITDDRGLELEAAGKASFGQFQENQCDALTVAGLQLVRVHVDLEAEVLKLDDDVLRCSHRVVILVPASDLVLVNGEQPGDKGDEVDELLGSLA